MEENSLLKKEVDRLKIEAQAVTSSTNDHLVKLRNEIEELKVSVPFLVCSLKMKLSNNS